MNSWSNTAASVGTLWTVAPVAAGGPPAVATGGKFSVAMMVVVFKNNKSDKVEIYDSKTIYNTDSAVSMKKHIQKRAHTSR